MQTEDEVVKSDELEIAPSAHGAESIDSGRYCEYCTVFLTETFGLYSVQNVYFTKQQCKRKSRGTALFRFAKKKKKKKSLGKS